jgi:hypothetical protein
MRSSGCVVLQAAALFRAAGCAAPVATDQRMSRRLQLKVVAPDLVARIAEEHAENLRWPRSFCVKWRFAGQGWRRCAASAPLPASFQSSATPEALVRLFGCAIGRRTTFQVLGSELKRAHDWTSCSRPRRFQSAWVPLIARVVQTCPVAITEALA